MFSLNLNKKRKNQNKYQIIYKKLIDFLKS